LKPKEEKLSNVSLANTVISTSMEIAVTFIFGRDTLPASSRGLYLRDTLRFTSAAPHIFIIKEFIIRIHHPVMSWSRRQLGRRLRNYRLARKQSPLGTCCTTTLEALSMCSNRKVDSSSYRRLWELSWIAFLMEPHR